MGYKFIDTDELIEEKSGIPISEIFEKYGENYFRDLEFKTCEEVSKMNNCVISTGGGTLTFERNAEILSINNIIVYLDVSFEKACERTKNDDTRPLFKDKKKAKLLYNNRKELYRKNSSLIIDGDLELEMTAKLICSKINI